MVRCSVTSFISDHAIAVNWSASSPSVSGVTGSGLSASIRMVASSSAAGSPMYSRTTTEDASWGICTHRAPTRSAGSSDERIRRELAGGQIQVDVADVIGHPPWSQAGAGEDLKSEVGGGAAGAGDPVAPVAADHRQVVGAVGIGTADHPGAANTYRRTTGGRGRPRPTAAHTVTTPGHDPQPLEEFPLDSASSVTIFVTSASICWKNPHAAPFAGT